MSIDLKSKMKSNIEPKYETPTPNIKDDTLKFKLSKKVDDKTKKDSFPLYMESDLKKDLDTICKKTKYSRNELINIMCKWCLDNLEITEE